MSDMPELLLLAYLFAGYVAYRRCFPLGLFASGVAERDRLRRVGRRRVLPLPADDGGDDP